MRNPSKENPLKKAILPQPQEIPSQINLSDIPDFLHPEESNSDLFIYLTQKVNWPYFSLQDIFQRQNNNSINTKQYKEWLNKIISEETEKKNKIINSAKNNNTKLLLESVHDYMVFLKNYFYNPYKDNVRTFIFLEYFLKKLETDINIINTDEYCYLYKLYIYLCRDAENIFDYLDEKKILTKNELFFYEKGC